MCLCFCVFVCLCVCPVSLSWVHRNCQGPSAEFTDSVLSCWNWYETSSIERACQAKTNKQNVCYMGHRRNKDHVTCSCMKVPTKTTLEKDSWVSFLALQTLMPTKAKLFLAWLHMLRIQHPPWFRMNTYSWREYLPGTALCTGFW